MEEDKAGNKAGTQMPKHIRLDDDVEVVKDGNNSWHLVLKSRNKA